MRIRKDMGGVPTPTLGVISLVCAFVFIKECGANKGWNVDQNRLEVATSSAETYRAHFSAQDRSLASRQSYQARNVLSRASNPPTNSYSRRYQRRRGYNEPEISYSHYTPVVITVPPARNIYKSLEDPAAFYKNKVFVNSTASEKRQRQAVPRVPYSENSIDSGDKKSADVSRTQDGVNIRLRGATIRVRPDAASRKTQWSIDENMDNSLSDSNAPPRTRETPSKDQDDSCVRCPAERTVIAARGRDKAGLEQPPLQACKTGTSPPPQANFRALYGPAIGDLLGEGSHITVGSIMIGNSTQQLCQYRFNVVVRRCAPLPAPPAGLQVTCPRGALWGAACRFSCTDSRLRLKGRARLFCKDDMKWSGVLPTCEEPPKGNWCDLRPVSRHGRMNCDTPTMDERVPSTAAPEGSVCSVWCDGAHRTAAPKVLTCKGAHWQGGPACRANRRRRHKKQRKNQERRRSDFDGM